MNEVEIIVSGLLTAVVFIGSLVYISDARLERRLMFEKMTPAEREKFLRRL